jgi:hypothetical protein
MTFHTIRAVGVVFLVKVCVLSDFQVYMLKTLAIGHVIFSIFIVRSLPHQTPSVTFHQYYRVAEYFLMG